MRAAVLSIAAILLSLALYLAANSLLGTLLAVRMSGAGFAGELIGPVLAFHSLGFVLGTFYCPPLIRRVGHIRSFAAWAAIACTVALLHPMAVHPLPWALLRGLTGFCTAGLMMVLESWVNDRTSNELRGAVMSFYMVTYYFAMGGGQMLLSVGAPGAVGLFMIVAILTALSLVPLALTRSRAPVLEDSELMGVRRLYRLAPVGLVGAAVAGTAMSGFMGVAPVYAERLGLNLGQISVFMAAAVLGGVLVQWPAGRLSDRLDRRWVILGLTALASLAALLAAGYGQGSFPRLLITGALFMGLVGSLYPLSVALANDSLHNHQIVSASATLLLSFGIGTIIGPIGGSLGIALFGPDGLFIFLSAVLGGLVVFEAYRVATARRRRPEEQEAYVFVASPTTTVIMNLDPRNEAFKPHVLTPSVERRQRRERRAGASPSGRRRGDANDWNE